jgi:hypothetical protein
VEFGGLEAAVLPLGAGPAPGLLPLNLWAVNGSASGDAPSGREFPEKICTPSDPANRSLSKPSSIASRRLKTSIRGARTGVGATTTCNAPGSCA